MFTRFLHVLSGATITVRHPTFDEQTRVVKLVPDGRIEFALVKTR